MDCKALVIKTARYWYKKRHTDQGKRTESPEIKPHSYGQLIFDRDAENVQRRKNHLLSKWSWEIWTSTCPRREVDRYLPPHPQINAKWIKDLKRSPENIELLEETIGSTLFDVELQRIFPSSVSSQTRETKEKLNKWDFIRLKNFCKAKETGIKSQRQPTNWEKILANPMSDKGFATTWLCREGIRLIEISQTEKDKHDTIPLVCGVETTNGERE